MLMDFMDNVTYEHILYIYIYIYIYICLYENVSIHGYPMLQI